jgi:hypothetical protein
VKIVKKLRDVHRDCTPRYERLAAEVQDFLKSKVESRGWFFLARIKANDSFALKVETGRVPDPAHLEDFFACTIVVPTTVEISDAEQMVLESYDPKERRPARADKTTNASSNFRFDDLRLYVARRPLASGRDEELSGVVFEVQIKTILQYAWSVATHDMIYKSDSVSWPLERIAYQVKAMLEHAEVAIANAEQLARAPAVAKEDRRTADVTRVIAHLRDFWSEDQLPADVKRLADTIMGLFRSCELNVDKLPEVMYAERDRVKGVPTDLSPYAFTVQALAHSDTVDFRRVVGRMRGESRIVIHEGMDLPDWMRSAHPKILDLDQIASS